MSHSNTRNVDFDSLLERERKLDDLKAQPDFTDSSHFCALIRRFGHYLTLFPLFLAAVWELLKSYYGIRRHIRGARGDRG